MLSLQHYRVICFSIPITGNCTILRPQPSCPDWKPWGNRLLYSLYYNKVSVTRQKCPVHPCMIWPPQIPYRTDWRSISTAEALHSLLYPNTWYSQNLIGEFAGCNGDGQSASRSEPAALLSICFFCCSHTEAEPATFQTPNAQRPPGPAAKLCPSLWHLLLRHAPEGSSEPYTGVSGMMG